MRDIYDFYAGELERAGRIATSNLVSEASATIVARHGPYGITISINETGMGTAVSMVLLRWAMDARGQTAEPIRHDQPPGGLPRRVRRASGGRPCLSSARLETFSDGVFAIAITLLVLDLTISAAGGKHLLRALIDLWPSWPTSPTSRSSDWCGWATT